MVLAAKPRAGPGGRLGAHLSKFRRLTQPYFLGLEHSGWQFAWLLACLLFFVVGLTFAMICGVLLLIRRFSPQTAKGLLEEESGMFKFVFNLYHSPGGACLMLLFILAVVSFARLASALRGRRWVPWALLGGVFFMLFTINVLNLGIGFIARDLTDALVDRNKGLSYNILFVYGSCFLMALPIRTLQFYLTQRLALLWREWLTSALLASYMGQKAYYSVNSNEEDATEVDNPDQRIADDTRSFTRESLNFTVNAMDAFMTLLLNIMVLWSISRTLTYALFVYASIATLALVIASHKLVSINYFQLRYEADFRYGLVHIRNNSEAIAFYSGEEPEKKESLRRLGSVVSNYNSLIRWEVIISVLRRMYGYAGYFFPYVFMIPAYLRGEVGYGSFTQAKFAFSQVEYALSFVVSNIDDMAQWWAGISRLEGFQSTVEEINRKGKSTDELLADCSLEEAAPEDLEAGKIERSRTSSSVRRDAIVLSNVRVQAPGSEQLLVDDLSLFVGRGDRVLVVGTSGCGKTSLLRAASGLWQPQTGTVERPPVGELLFVPQKPYMLLGSLREQLCYPVSIDSFSDEDLRNALQQVRLSHLVERYPDLGVKQDWPRLLSLGEQQRLAFARLLLNSPEFAVLDEATSALDVHTEQALYEMLVQRGVAIISVGHRPSLKSYHDQVLELQGQGKWRLIPSAKYEFGAA